MHTFKREKYADEVIDCSIKNGGEEFKTFLESLDEKLNDLAKENISLFDTKKENANANYTYHPLLKQNKDYPKLLKLMFSTLKKFWNFCVQSSIILPS